MVNKEKAAFSSVVDDVKPFLTKRFLKSSYIEKDQVLPLVAKLTAKYSNVFVRQKIMVDREYIEIEIRRFLSGGKLLYEIRDHGVPIYNDTQLIPFFFDDL